jgi:hypothetical protein
MEIYTAVPAAMKDAPILEATFDGKRKAGDEAAELECNAAGAIASAAGMT